MDDLLKPRLRCYMNIQALDGLPQSADPLPAIRETEAEPSQRVREMVATSSQKERVGVGD